MHQTSPGVERAVAAARTWADRLGSEPVCLAHLVLALLDEEEGRPAVLLEHVGISVPHVRSQLAELESPPAPPLTALNNAARAWSIAHRHDPALLTDAFLIAGLVAVAGFRAACAAHGFPPELLERTLTKSTAVTEPEPEFAVFELPDTTAEVDACRIIDANFNRAREAARVLEDHCRFALDDRFLTEQVKELRHGLAEAARKLPQNALLAARETLRDVGTTATASGEYERASPARRVRKFETAPGIAAKFRGVRKGVRPGPRPRPGSPAVPCLHPRTGRFALRPEPRAPGICPLVRVAHPRACTAALDWTIREAARRWRTCSSCARRRCRIANCSNARETSAGGRAKPARCSS